MLITFIEQRLQQLDPEYQSMILGNFVQNTSEIFSEMLSLDSEKQIIFENALLLFFLCFLNKEELVHLLITSCAADIELARKAVDTITGELPVDFQKEFTDAYVAFEESSTDSNLLSTKVRMQILYKTPLSRAKFYIFVSQAKNIRNLIDKYKIDSIDTIFKINTLLGDLVLGFYKIEDTVPLLQQELGLDPRTAALLGADVIDFLAPLKDPNWQPPTEAEISSDVVTEDVATTVDEILPIPTKAPIPNSPVVTSTATAPSTPPPVYTPQQYTPTPEPIYQSTQPSRADLSSIPSYMPNVVPPTAAAVTEPEPDRPRPRWSSEF